MSDNLYKRGRIWWVRIQVAGREHRRSLRTDIRKEALEELGKIKKEFARKRYFGADRMTWDVAAVRYGDEVMPKALKKSTIKRYKVSILQVTPFLTGKFMDGITQKDIGSIVSARQKAEATNATIRRDLTAVSRVFTSAKTWGACEHNPARDYDRQIIRERRDPIRLPFAKEIIQAIGKAPNGLFGSLIRFAARTGMREAEILSLEWPQVDLSRGITLVKTKTDSPRIVPLSGPLLSRAIGTLAGTERKRGHPFVFGQEDGHPYRNFPSVFAAWRRRNDVLFRFHDLRHYFAVTYLKHRGNIYDLQRILGHSSIKTTEGYLAYLTPDERMAAMHG